MTTAMRTVIGFLLLAIALTICLAEPIRPPGISSSEGVTP